MTDEEIRKLGADPADFVISEDDFDTGIAKRLKKDPEFKEAFKEEVIRDFNESHDMRAFLNNLKILAMAGSVPELAAKVNIGRTNIYKVLNGRNNPSFASIMAIAAALGLQIFVRRTKA